jgi:eukaryotic translation initiation factor 2C
MRKQVPPEKTKGVLEFATKRPQDRLNSIRAGLGVCESLRSQSHTDSVFHCVNRCFNMANLNMSGCVQQKLTILWGLTDRVLQQFGLHVNDTQGPLSVNARILNPPTLQYGTGSAQRNVVSLIPCTTSCWLPTTHSQTPRNGAWNMIDKKFVNPSQIVAWCIVVYETQNKFGQRQADELVKSMQNACQSVGECRSSRTRRCPHLRNFIRNDHQ